MIPIERQQELAKTHGSSTLGLNDHPTIKHPFCLLFDPNFSTGYLDPNVARSTNLQHQDSEHKVTQRQSQGVDGRTKSE